MTAERIPPSIHLPLQLQLRMIEHAQCEYPYECCGLLVGKNRCATRAVPMRSTHPAPDSYDMDPEQQIAVFTEMEKRGEMLVGIYHSHPAGPAHPSGMDLQLAFHPEAVYVIISLQDRHKPEVGAFVLETGRFSKIAVEPAAR